MKIYICESADWLKVKEEKQTRKDITNAVRKAELLTSRLLNDDFLFTNIIVQPNASIVIPEYGVGGYIQNSELINVSFNTDFKLGYEETLHRIFLATLHELNHSVRWSNIEWQTMLVEGCVLEGLATVFERDAGKCKPLYSIYEDEKVMFSWLKEIIATGSYDSPEYKNLLFSHPDGRRWVVYKVGTWIVDRAIERSDKPMSELVRMDAETLMRLADLSEYCK